jgi:hypothetical protein
MLRSRLESQLSFILNNNNNSNRERYQEVTKILELVRNGERILGEISDKVESTRLLEEFIRIMDEAAMSVNEIKIDIEQLMPIAELALQDIHNAISTMPVADILPELEQEIELAILAEASSVIAKKKENEGTPTTTNFVTSRKSKDKEISST